MAGTESLESMGVDPEAGLLAGSLAEVLLEDTRESTGDTMVDNPGVFLSGGSLVGSLS